MHGFTFYKSFYDTICKIRKKQDRASVALAVLEYMFEDSEPQGLTETGEIAFESFKHTLNTAKSKGMNGGTKRNETAIKSKSNQNQTQIKTETNDNQNEIKSKTRLSSSLSISSITPLCISPQGDKNKDFEALFFEKYPKYAKSKGKNPGIDFEKLLREFEKSSYLRTLYTFKQVVDIYEAILNGDYRDKETATSGADAKAERERWYAKRKDIAMSKQEAILEKLCKRKDFFEAKGRIASLEIAIAKAQCADDLRTEEQLTAEYEDLIEKRHEILRKCGYTEADLEPRWHCEKCGDTGFMPDGRMCDCYEVAQ